MEGTQQQRLAPPESHLQCAGQTAHTWYMSHKHAFLFRATSLLLTPSSTYWRWLSATYIIGLLPNNVLFPDCNLPTSRVSSTQFPARCLSSSSLRCFSSAVQCPLTRLLPFPRGLRGSTSSILKSSPGLGSPAWSHSASLPRSCMRCLACRVRSHDPPLHDLDPT